MGTLVQNNRGYEAASDNSWQVAFTSNVTSSNLLVAVIGAYHDTATINTPTDTIGTTYVEAGTLLRATATTADTMLAIYYGIAPSSGANTVTVTFSTSVGDKELKIWEISGVDTTTPLNQTNGASGVTGGSDPNTVLSGSITTTVPGFIIKAVQEWQWGTHAENFGTPTTGWTEFGDTATGSDSAYRNESSTGTFDGGFSISVSNNPWCCRIVAFADRRHDYGFSQNHLRPRAFAPGLAR